MKSSKLGYVIGGVLFVLGLLGAGLISYSSGANAIDATARGGVTVRVGGPPAQVELKEKGTHGIYAEHPTTVSVTVTGPRGPVTVNKVSGTQTLKANGTDLHQVASFDVPEPGSYTVTVKGTGEESLQILPLSVGGIIGTVFAALGGGCLVSLIGLGIVLFTLIKNTRAEKRARAAGTPPTGFPPGPPPGTPA